MTRRAVALLLTASPASAAPPGVDQAAFAHAMAEDVVDLLADLALVEPVVLTCAARQDEARALAWSPDQVRFLPAEDGIAGVFGLLEHGGFDIAAVVAPDAPDLPGMVVAKTLRAVQSRPVAASPARGGGLVVLTCRLPAPGWLTAAGVDLDTPDAMARLRAAAPDPADVVSAPGWHRLRHPGDTDGLDPGLEGWEATRALLSRSATG